ncbi:response regulator [Pantoea vagans]|uniref:response regulator n=1 Tax=Pantoea vagans TaxID=470934 RepID=UPI0028E70ECD|nr:response regulator [Pantoea vagans]
MQLSQRIVVIDDERSVRSGLTNLLRSEGYQTEAFESAESLLGDEAAMANASLFIIDVQLKGMNGFELFINLTRRIKNPPGIIISGNGDESTLRYAINLGAVAYLPKPIDIDTLFEHIRQVFSLKGAHP